MSAVRDCARWYVHDFTDVDPANPVPCVTVSAVSPDHIEVCAIGNGLTATRAEMIEVATLIAAAPALLRFAEVAAEHAESVGDEYGAEMARAVIRLARGEK